MNKDIQQLAKVENKNDLPSEDVHHDDSLVEEIHHDNEELASAVPNPC